jgi:hypothetical protein
MTAPRKKPAYTLSKAALAQRRAAARSRYEGRTAKEFATVRIDRRIRDAVDAVREPDESIAAVVTAAAVREVKRRGGDLPKKQP